MKNKKIFWIIWILAFILLIYFWVESLNNLAYEKSDKLVASYTWDERLCMERVKKLEEEKVLFKTIETKMMSDNIKLVAWTCIHKWEDKDFFCMKDMDLDRAFYQVSLWTDIIFEDFTRLSDNKL